MPPNLFSELNRDRECGGGFAGALAHDVSRCNDLFCCIQTPWDAECDVWWDEAMSDSSEECEPEWLDAEDPLFILYTSGSTGKPKVGRKECSYPLHRKG